MEEEWRIIDGFDGKFLISNRGRIMDMDYHNKGEKKEIKPYLIRGYPTVTFFYKKKRYPFRVHRLVAMAFVPNPQNFPYVNHKDETRNNNNVDNLEWCTQKYNNTYGTAIQRAVTKRKKPVEQYTTDGAYIATHDSALDAALSLGYKKDYRSLITRSCKGKSGVILGYIWKYADEEMKEKYEGVFERHHKEAIKKQIERKMLSGKKVVQYNLDGTFVNEYISGADAARKTGLCKTCIYDVCKGKLKQTGGYLFKYKDK